MNVAAAIYVTQSAEFLSEALGSLQYTHAYWIFLAPLIMEALDILTGWLQATINKTWDSTKMRYGLMRKAGMMSIVIVAYIFEFAISAVANAHVATFASVYVVVMEMLSVCENLDQAGIAIPKFVRDRLAKVKDNLDNAGGTQE